MKLHRTLWVVLAMLWQSQSLAAIEMTTATNLEETAKTAQVKNIPIALLISFKGLNSTRDLKEEAIFPNLLSGQFDDAAIFQEIQVNTEGKTIDFYGEALPNSEYQTLFNVSHLPVLIFVDTSGNHLTSPLIAGNYEFYGHYLKQKLNQALDALNNPMRLE
jgi:hypothetical protein